jgi:hypothetical protein
VAALFTQHYVRLPPPPLPPPAAAAAAGAADAAAAGIPQTDMLRIYEGFVTSFDMRTRNPKWVLEYINNETLKGEGTRCRGGGPSSLCTTPPTTIGRPIQHCVSVIAVLAPHKACCRVLPL